MPRIAIVPRNIHAAGQCSVPATANNGAPIATIQIRFYGSSFAIMPCPACDAVTMIAVFSANLRRGSASS